MFCFSFASCCEGCLLELCCREYILFLTMCIIQMNGTLIKAIDSVGDPPLPIPNREVKPVSADGTAKIRGRVGHRHFSERELQAIEALFFLFFKVFIVLRGFSVPACFLPEFGARWTFWVMKPLQ